MLKRLLRRLWPRDFAGDLRSWLVQGDALRSVAVLDTMRHVNLVQAEQTLGPSSGPVLILAPHPDDEVIGPGGTLIGLLQRKISVTVAYLTNGSNDPAKADIRRAEASAAAMALGFSPRFLGLATDGIPLADGAAALDRLIAELQPTAVMLPFLLDDNDDHRRVNELLLHMQALPPALPIWAYQVYTALPANRIVDITDQAEAKRQAIQHHASQVARRDWAHFALGLNAVNMRQLKTPGARYGETFVELPASEYLQLCRSYFEPDATACYIGQTYRSRAT